MVRTETDAATSGWQVIGATARGALHVKTGLPNQDCHSHTAATERGEGIILAVADGHGDRRAVRADVGARLAVTAATACARELVARLETRAVDGSTLETSARELVDDIVDSWRAAVGRHAAEHPWHTRERELIDPQARTELRYGCTLLVAVIVDSRLLLTQIGDGDVLVVDEDGSTAHPIRPSSTLVGGETLSLAASDAASIASTKIVELAGSTRLVMLATDGYANSFESAHWDQSIGADYVRLLREHGASWMAEQLPEWVEASAQAAGDDVTVLLATRSSDAPKGGS